MPKTTYHIVESSAEQTGLAVQKSADAFAVYRHIPPARKAIFLEALAGRLDMNREPLTSVAADETALAEPRLDAELNRTILQLRLFADLLKEGSWVRAIIDTSITNDKGVTRPDLRQMQHPLGPVAVFGASNFPFAYSVLGGDTVAAFAAGCPVIYKANPGHPQTSRMVAAIVEEAGRETGMPDGLFSMIEGKSHEAGLRLVTHPSIKAVGFTGSLAGGRALYDAAAKRPEPIPVYAEMGSVNPVFILPHAMSTRSQEIARTLALSNTASVGQFCTNPGIIISKQSDATNSYLDNFGESIRNTPIASMLTESIFANFRKATDAVANKNYMSVLAQANDQSEEKARAQTFLTDAKHFLEDKQLWEEMFGPASIQVVAGDTSEMTAIANALPGQITVSVWGTDKDLAEHSELLHILELKAGRIIVNGVPTGVEVVAAMNHGGPYPATTDSKFTSVGTQSIYRFTRPVCYQNFPQSLLPSALQDANPGRIWRLVNGRHTAEPIQ